MEQLEVLALARLDELHALNALKQTIDSAISAAAIITNNSKTTTEPQVKSASASTNAPLLSRSSTSDQEPDSTDSSATATPQDLSQPPQKFSQSTQQNFQPMPPPPPPPQPRIDGISLDLMKKKLLRDILASKKAEHIRVSQEKEIIETFYHIQNLTVNDRKSFERVSHRLMQRINPAFNVPPPISENPISQIVLVYREFFCSIRQSKQALEIDRIFANSLCNKFSFVCLLINWLIEVTRSMLKEFILASKSDDSRRSPLKKPIIQPVNSLTTTTNTQNTTSDIHDQDLSENNTSTTTTGNMHCLDSNGKSNSIQSDGVLRYLRLLNSEKKQSNTATADSTSMMITSRSGHSLESNIARQSKRDKNHLIYMFLHEGVLVPPPPLQPAPSAFPPLQHLAFHPQASQSKQKNSFSSHIFQLLNSADKLTMQVLQSQSINCASVTKDFLYNTHLQMTSEYKLYAETLFDLDHTYTASALSPWIGSSSHCNKQQQSRKLAALHSSKEWVESNYIAILRAQLNKNAFIKSTILDYKSEVETFEATKRSAESTTTTAAGSISTSSPIKRSTNDKQNNNISVLLKSSNKKKLDFYLQNAVVSASHGSASAHNSCNSSPLKPIVQYVTTSAAGVTNFGDFRNKLVSINSATRAVSRKKHKPTASSGVAATAAASNSSNSNSIEAGLKPSTKLRVDSDLILSRIASERKQQQQSLNQSSYLPAQPASPSKSRVKSSVSQSDHKVRASLSRTTRGGGIVSASTEDTSEQYRITLPKSKTPEVLPSVLTSTRRSSSRRQRQQEQEVKPRSHIDSEQDLRIETDNPAYFRITKDNNDAKELLTREQVGQCDNTSDRNNDNWPNQVSINQLIHSNVRNIHESDETQFNSIQHDTTGCYIVEQNHNSQGEQQQQQQQLGDYELLEGSSKFPCGRSKRLISKSFLQDILLSTTKASTTATMATTATANISIPQSQQLQQQYYDKSINALDPQAGEILAGTGKTPIREQQNDLVSDQSKKGIRSVSAIASILPQPGQQQTNGGSKESACAPPSVPLQQQIQLITQWKGRFKKQIDESSDCAAPVGGVKGLSVNGMRQSQQSWLTSQQQQQIVQQQSSQLQQKHRSSMRQSKILQEATSNMNNNSMNNSLVVGETERGSNGGVASRVTSLSVRRHGSIDSSSANVNASTVLSNIESAVDIGYYGQMVTTERLSVLRKMQKTSQCAAAAAGAAASAYLGEQLSDLTGFGVTQQMQQQSMSRKLKKKLAGLADSIVGMNASHHQTNTSAHCLIARTKTDPNWKKEEQIKQLQSQNDSVSRNRQPDMSVEQHSQFKGNSLSRRKEHESTTLSNDENSAVMLPYINRGIESHAPLMNNSHL